MDRREEGKKRKREREADVPVYTRCIVPVNASHVLIIPSADVVVINFCPCPCPCVEFG